MNTAEQVLDKFEQLPVEQQQEVLDFVEFLAHKNTPNVPRHNPLGLWSGYSPELSEDEIDHARKEQWDRFPTEDV